MAYSKKYFLVRVQQVNEVYLKYHRQGATNIFIYENYVKYQFGISLVTFYRYLTIPYKSLMNEIERKEKENDSQTELFKEIE